jgi:hypothetical protein
MSAKDKAKAFMFVCFGAVSILYGLNLVFGLSSAQAVDSEDEFVAISNDARYSGVVAVTKGGDAYLIRYADPELAPDVKRIGNLRAKSAE